MRRRPPVAPRSASLRLLRSSCGRRISSPRPTRSRSPSSRVSRRLCGSRSNELRNALCTECEGRWTIPPPMRALLILLWTWPAFAADIDADPSSYRALLPTLAPGDRLILAAGEYGGLPIQDLNGAEGSPIVITGPENGA